MKVTAYDIWSAIEGDSKEYLKTVGIEIIINEEKYRVFDLDRNGNRGSAVIRLYAESEERSIISDELEEFYTVRNDLDNFSKIFMFTEGTGTQIKSTSVQKKSDPTLSGIANDFPVVKLDNDDEIIILLPSESIRKTRTAEEAAKDAEFVCSKVNRLLEIREGKQNGQ